MKGRNAIIKSILICMIILIFLNFFQLNKYNEFVYYILSILTILCGSLIISNNSITGYRYIYIIIDIVSLLIPLIWLSYTNTKYNSQIKNIQSYNSLINISNILLLIQMILLGYNYFNISTNTILMVQIILMLINTFISGIIWKESVYFVTDGYSNLN
jgi:hypothetical protein